MPRTKLVVRLLGGFRVDLDGEAVYDFESDKGRALLAYLMVESDRPHRRETLADLLWPDRPEDVARANLRQALSRVRRALREADHEPPLFLFVTPTDVQFNTRSDHTLDVAELEAFSRAPARYSQLLPDAFCRDFLAGLTAPDSEAFQEWALNRQEYYHRLASEILDEQNAYFESIHDYERAVAAARLQVQLEPWLEEAHRRYMRALALAGRRDEALRQYESCRRALQSELGVEPATVTQALYADIRAGRLLAADLAGQALCQEVSRQPDACGAQRQTPVSASPRRLVAREDEMGQLRSRLDAALAGETQVAFVSGDAGSGKTALLEAFAASALADYAELLAAGARCNPSGGQDACAPLRRLAEMLFGDLANDVAWRLPGREQIHRLQGASRMALTALAEHGLGLVDTLVPAASVARRASLYCNQAIVDHPAWREVLGAGAVGPLWVGPLWLNPLWAGRSALAERPQPAGPLFQGALFDQLICTIAAIAREQPLLLLFDDLHWVDDASAALLLRIGRELRDSRVLVVGAYRLATVAIGRRDPLSGEISRHPLAVVINELRRSQGEILIELNRADGRAFVEAYLDTEPNRLGARFRDTLHAQTGGHALFTVELLRNLREREELFRDEVGRWVARESLDWGALPARVEAAISERIDRLPEPSRRILAAASVQGDDFTGEIAAELAGAPVGEALACLSGSLARQHCLVRPEELQRLTGAQRSAYRFTHHLFQKYLYDQLDPVERAHLHGAVAAALDRQVAGDAAERERLSARLAWHYEAGGLPLQAARALLNVGRQAMRVSAFREALNRFDHGLALVAQASEPSTPERTEIKRLLEIARLGPLRCLEGLGSANLQGALAQVTEAWADHAEGWPRLMMALRETERLLACAQFEEALAAAERLRAEAAQQGEEGFAGLAYTYFGTIQHQFGKLAQSEASLDQARAMLTRERRAEVIAAIGVDALAGSFTISALNQWFLGHAELALARSRQAIAGALAEGAVVGQASSLALGAYLLFLLRGEEKAMAEISEQCRRLGLEQGMGMWEGFVEVLLGRSMVMRGEAAAGFERMRAGIAAWQARGMVIASDYLVVVLADSCLIAADRRPSPTLPGDTAPNGVPRHCGSADDSGGCIPRWIAAGLAAIDTMLDPTRVACCQLYEAELRRLRGELLLARDGLAASVEALACFQRALQLGREQGALAWELRAAMSLVRLRLRQGEGRAKELAEAREGLRAIYARFTEGFAFPDLQDAAALTGGHTRQEIDESTS